MPDRRLNLLGRAVDKRIQALQEAFLRQSSTARAELAKLRRGLGKPAGSVPEIWDLTIGSIPASVVWAGGRADGEPTPAEQATHVALTLYAAHQQSLPVPVHIPGVPFGRALWRLTEVEGRSEDAVVARFMAAATAETVDELLTHVRGLILQLRSARIGFDYAMFADDIVGLFTPGHAQRVRLAWGRGFYYSRREDADTETTESTETDN
ncbi:type I-E CRISPR-associated protein Cse2/CasB [Nocardia cyriacigeorgica]|uniref:type I-E CRISPR-associated protein Cse2/CasB n=1 Tax=Nocardia cyriacigeorgica TaxID=135487 RepID=UPI001893D41F|nr:type I-E CRISPR-associated protein Cse2/CasB [Nocardia cyriacigeorgica]MBF6416869.1 type I-E CRISPR-associated protein Cse2/CasB [Nocardia cyriacigeorgica]